MSQSNPNFFQQQRPGRVHNRFISSVTDFLSTSLTVSRAATSQMPSKNTPCASSLSFLTHCQPTQQTWRSIRRAKSQHERVRLPAESATMKGTC